MVSHGFWITRIRFARRHPRVYLLALLSFFTSSLFVINVHQVRTNELEFSAAHPQMAVGVNYDGVQGEEQQLFLETDTVAGGLGQVERPSLPLRQAMAIPAFESPRVNYQQEVLSGRLKEHMLIGNALKPSRQARKWDKLRVKYSAWTLESDESVHLAGSPSGSVRGPGMFADLANISLAELETSSRDIWPGKERGDRILSQMYHIPVSHRDVMENNQVPLRQYKKIYVYNGLPEGVPSRERKFEIDMCPVRDCFLTDDSEEAASADVILFSGQMGRPLPTKPPNQLWIMFFLESPIHTQDLVQYQGLVNWTATYRRDSTIVTPYEKFVPYTNYSSLPAVPAQNYAHGKTKKVAWFVSNCYTTNGRMVYARELAKHIDVDIYGDCGRMRCPRASASVCFDMLKKDYKFYLSFENSNCRDYITEKFFTNALDNQVIPIVMGAHPDDYQKVAPPNSFIHVDKFSSPKELAKYLHRLDKNDTLYNEYFSWKGTGRFINTRFWCRLCSLIHEKNSYVTWYEKIRDWWAGNGMCRKNANDRTWSSWRKL